MDCDQNMNAQNNIEYMIEFISKKNVEWGNQFEKFMEKYDGFSQVGGFINSRYYNIGYKVASWNVKDCLKVAALWERICDFKVPFLPEGACNAPETEASWGMKFALFAEKIYYDLEP
jgi:hypothetical protein